MKPWNLSATASSLRGRMSYWQWVTIRRSFALVLARCLTNKGLESSYLFYLPTTSLPLFLPLQPSLSFTLQPTFPMLSSSFHTIPQFIHPSLPSSISPFPNLLPSLFSLSIFLPLFLFLLSLSYASLSVSSWLLSMAVWMQPVRYTWPMKGGTTTLPQRAS